MAIDTAEKRRSAAGVGFWVVGPGVTPNSSQDAEWRQQAGWGYSGIAADTPSITVAYGPTPRSGASGILPTPKAGTARFQPIPTAGVTLDQVRRPPAGT